jgi:hypothetical protein
VFTVCTDVTQSRDHAPVLLLEQVDRLETPIEVRSGLVPAITVVVDLTAARSASEFVAMS